MYLRFVKLPVDRIFNWMAPHNCTAWSFYGHKYGDRWNDPDVVELRKEYADKWVEIYDQKTKHFSKLRKSIKYEGIKNPISCVSGPYRSWKNCQEIKDQRAFPKDDDVVWTSPFGGSRLLVAKELGIETVACVVHDWAELFNDKPWVNVRNYKKWFTEEYYYSGTKPHMRCRKFVPATKKIQQEVTKLTREWAAKR